MKKTFLGLAVLGLIAFTSCKKEADKAAETADKVANSTADAASNVANTTVDAAQQGTQAVENTAKNISNAATQLLTGAPSFGVKEADDFVGQVKTFVNEVSAAGTDVTKVQQITAAKSPEIQKGFAMALTKLNPEQRKQLQDWYVKVSTALSTGK